eukprot:1141387-Pelagomonas_calceolata.AAC.4
MKREDVCTGPSALIDAAFLHAAAAVLKTAGMGLCASLLSEDASLLSHKQEQGTSWYEAGWQSIAFTVVHAVVKSVTVINAPRGYSPVHYLFDIHS